MPKKGPYTILALGDSVVWGEGLKEKDRFVQIVAKGLKKKIGRPVRVFSLAHSGAKIREKIKAVPFVEAVSSDTHTNDDEKLFVHGSINQYHPTVHTQLHIASLEKEYEGYLAPHHADIPEHAERKAELKEGLGAMSTPNLIILNGGANDFNPYRVFVPFSDELLAKLGSEKTVKSVMDRIGLYTKEEDFQELAEEYFYGRLKELLIDVRKRWPLTPIVVVGYYPTFTSGSFEGDDDAIIPLMLYAFLRVKKTALPTAKSFKGFIDLYTKLGRKFLEQRSTLFDRTHREAMARACNEVNSTSAPIIFSAPDFGAENGAFAKKAWLHGWEPVVWDVKNFPRVVEILAPKDPLEKERKRATEAYLSYFKKEMSLTQIVERREHAYRNAVAHPNKKGAKAYANEILHALEQIQKSHSEKF